MTKMTSTELLLKRALACQAAALRELITRMVPWIQVQLVRRHLIQSASSPSSLESGDEIRLQIAASTRQILRDLFADDARRLRDFQTDDHPSLQHFVTQITDEWSNRQNFCQNRNLDSE